MLGPTDPRAAFAVIFCSTLTGQDEEGYGIMADEMVALAAGQPGYCGIVSARGDDGVGITISWWESLEAIADWKAVARHRQAQRIGRARWYRDYSLHVVKVERAYGFSRDG